MRKLLTAAQMREADGYTILNKPISSTELMEAAAVAFCSEFVRRFPDRTIRINVYCGTGNNGGDGLAIARILHQNGYDIDVTIARFSANSSADFDINLKRFHASRITVTELYEGDSMDDENTGIIIDALLGSGLNKPLSGSYKALVEHLNLLHKPVIAVDVPAGFFTEGNIDEQAAVLYAQLAISFQRPKINFFFPESATALADFVVVDIGLDEHFIEHLPSCFKLIEHSSVAAMLKPREKFSHKGTYGHALIIAGAPNTMGAALLCADACLHSGAGLISACIPAQGFTALNTRLPEVMVTERGGEIDYQKYNAVAIGPGLGVDAAAIELMEQAIDGVLGPLVLDADALNILGASPGLLARLPVDAVLTPHLKEFDRLFGTHSSWWQRIQTAREKATELSITIVLKNQYTFIIQKNGEVYINPTGNAAMATGGMGDVLTGILTSFIAQGHDPADAAILACYVHGLAGDVLNKKSGMFCIPPRYLIKKLPQIIGQLIH